MEGPMDLDAGSPRGVKRKAEEDRLATQAPKRIKVTTIDRFAGLGQLTRPGS